MQDKNDILGLLDALESIIGEVENQSDEDQYEDPYEDIAKNKTSIECINVITEGTLNSYLENGSFPSSEQVRTLLQLQALKYAVRQS